MNLQSRPAQTAKYDISVRPLRESDLSTADHMIVNSNRYRMATPTNTTQPTTSWYGLLLVIRVCGRFCKTSTHHEHDCREPMSAPFHRLREVAYEVSVNCWTAGVRSDMRKAKMRSGVFL